MRIVLLATLILLLLGCSTGAVNVRPHARVHGQSEVSFLYDMAQINQDLAEITKEAEKRRRECAAFGVLPLVNSLGQSIPRGWC